MFNPEYYHCSFEYNPPGGREKESQKTCTFPSEMNNEKYLITSVNGKDLQNFNIQDTKLYV